MTKKILEFTGSYDNTSVKVEVDENIKGLVTLRPIEVTGGDLSQTQSLRILLADPVKVKAFRELPINEEDLNFNFPKPFNPNMLKVITEDIKAMLLNLVGRNKPVKASE